MKAHDIYTNTTVNTMLNVNLVIIRYNLSISRDGLPQSNSNMISNVHCSKKYFTRHSSKDKAVMHEAPPLNFEIPFLRRKVLLCLPRSMVERRVYTTTTIAEER